VESRSPAPGAAPNVGAMPELHVEPQVLADAGRSLATQRSVLADAAGAVVPALAAIAAALPGSRTAGAATETGSTLAAAIRSGAAELAQLAAAFTAAAREYRSAERVTATGFEPGRRRPT
jgi:hypothetical protein